MTWETARQILIGDFDLIMALTIIWKVIVVLIYSYFIGRDREQADRPAGLRTQMLLCLGIMSIIMTIELLGWPVDAKSRVIALIGPLIGGIALGTVVQRENKEVIGLTTAVSMIATSGIALQVGLGMIWQAGILTVATYFVLNVLKGAEERIKN